MDLGAFQLIPQRVAGQILICLAFAAFVFFPYF